MLDINEKWKRKLWFLSPLQFCFLTLMRCWREGLSFLRDCSRTSSLQTFSSVQLLSHVQLFVTPWGCSTPGFPVLHYLPEFAQTHVHWVNDAMQPSHPLLPPSLPALNPSQHQGLFQWVRSSYQVAKELELQLQHQSFQWIFRVIFFRIEWFAFLASQGTLKTLPAPQFKSINSLVLSLLCGPSLTSVHDHWKNHSLE